MRRAAIELGWRSTRADFEGEERANNLARLAQATYDGRRLASFRRRIGTGLLLTGVPLIVFSRATDPTVHRVLSILLLLFLTLVLPMVRLLCVEWHNSRLTDDLRARVDSDRR